MSHDKQDKKYAESRSKIGSMSYKEILKHTGIDVNPDEEDMEHESGTPDDRDEMRVKGNSN